MVKENLIKRKMKPILEECLYRAIPQGFSSTRGIANKGFSGMRRVSVRFNFSCTLIGNRPQSLTGHTAIVTINFNRTDRIIPFDTKKTNITNEIQTNNYEK